MIRESTITPAEAVLPNGHTHAAIALAPRTDGTVGVPIFNGHHEPLGTGGERQIMTPLELKLLAALAANPLAVVSKKALLNALWEDGSLMPLPSDTQIIVNVHVSHLRKKLGDTEDPQHPGAFRLIHTFEKRGLSLTARLGIQPRDQTSEAVLAQQKELGVRRRLLPNGKELVLDDARCLAYLYPQGQEIPLFPNESSILAILMDQSSKTVLESHFKDLNIHALKSHIMRLKQKLAYPAIIETRHLGYALLSLDEDAKTDESLLRYQTAQGEIVLDTQRQTFQVPHAKEPVLLTPSETKLLAAFLKDPAKVYSSDDFCRILWPDPNSEPQDTYNDIKLHVSHLRQKIKPLEIYGIHSRGWTLTPTEEYVKAFLAGIESQDAKAKLAPNIKCFAGPEGNYYLLTDRNALIFPNGQIAGLRYQQTVIIEVLMQNPHQIFPKGIFKEKGIPEKSLTSNIKDARILGLPIYSHYDQGYSLTPRYGATNGRHPSSDGTVVFESPLHPETIPTK